MISLFCTSLMHFSNHYYHDYITNSFIFHNYSLYFCTPLFPVHYFLLPLFSVLYTPSRPSLISFTFQMELVTEIMWKEIFNAKYDMNEDKKSKVQLLIGVKEG